MAVLNMPTDRIPLEWGATVVYQWDYGRRMMPVGAVLGTAPRFVQLHAGYNVKVVTWVTEYVGNNPVVPSPLSVSSNEVILSALLSAPIPGVLSDGTPRVAITGQYVYGLLVPVNLGVDAIPLGTLPFVLDGVRSLNPSDFSQFLIGVVPNPTGGPQVSQVLPPIVGVVNP